MSILTKFELNKIMRKKSFFAGVAILLFMSVFIAFIDISSEGMPDDTGKELSGMSAISLKKQYDLQHTGLLDEKKLASIINHYHEIRKDPQNLDPQTKKITSEAYVKFQMKDDGVLRLLRNAFSPKGQYNYEIVDSLSSKDASTFYDKRMERVNEYLNMEYTYGNYSNEDKAYYQKMNESISVPFKFDYTRGWEMVLRDLQGLFFIIAFVICICIAPLFAGEYQCGADSIILSSRYGRNKVISAKLKASVLITTGLFLFCILCYTFVLLGIYGFNGWNVNIQIIELLAPVPFTILQTYLWTILIGYLACLLMMAFTLLLSSKMKAPFSVIICSLVLLIAPMFIPSSKSSRLFNHLTHLLPSNLLDSYASITRYEVYHISRWLIPEYKVMIGVAVLITVLLMPLAYRGFKNHQVN